jgi:hypothetical protein
MRRLGDIVYHPKHAVPQSRIELDNPIAELRATGLLEATSYLETATPQVFTTN